MAKSTPITRSAKGQDCQLMIAPYCNGDPSTTVLCHINCLDKATGFKSPDWWSAYGCLSCHDVIDRKVPSELSELEMMRIIFNGIYRTHKLLIDQGLLRCVW